MKKAIEILLVEDNPGDVHLTLHALRATRIENSVRVANDGEAALRALGALPPEGSKAVRPDLILLDLNLPRKTGHEVLAAIREDPDTRSIPVVVLTSSERESDIASAYGLAANCYITKPVDVDSFIEVVASISDFWFSIAKLPGAGEH